MCLWSKIDRERILVEAEERPFPPLLCVLENFYNKNLKTSRTERKRQKGWGYKIIVRRRLKVQTAMPGSGCGPFFVCGKQQLKKKSNLGQTWSSSSKRFGGITAIPATQAKTGILPRFSWGRGSCAYNQVFSSDFSLTLQTPLVLLCSSYQKITLYIMVSKQGWHCSFWWGLAGPCLLAGSSREESGNRLPRGSS